MLSMTLKVAYIEKLGMKCFVQIEQTFIDRRVLMSSYDDVIAADFHLFEH